MCLKLVQVLKDVFYLLLYCIYKTHFNPCEHRATIVAQAYLKSSKKGKKRGRRILSFKHIIKNFDSVPKK
jgi:hypothetical protein